MCLRVCSQGKALVSVTSSAAGKRAVQWEGLSFATGNDQQPPNFATSSITRIAGGEKPSGECSVISILNVCAEGRCN